MGLQADLQQSLVTSLQLGLTNLGVDPVFSLCCDFIQVNLRASIFMFRGKN